MTVDERERSLTAEQDTCEIFTYDPAKVERLKADLAGTEGLALIFKALADDTRVRIALALSHEELCVCDVAHLMSISVATASHHLRLLRNMGLVKYRKEGKLVFYSLDDAHVVTIIRTALDHFGEAKHK
ncbi:MAG TPA: metalloregulator ArsR/SmtB family transcription factor [Symbiobacteriaceae bacterium]|nr:metalloregulator ArsR/SmtB family transcription factor [Symbiobacteriaceae bacterium]